MSDMTPDRAELMARTFVNGLVDEIKHGERTGRKVLHTAHWAPVFQDHPWVKAADEEGWARDLRSAVVLAAKRRIMVRQPYHDIDQLMPGKHWVDYIREKAAREKSAMAWRDEMAEKHGSFDAFISKTKGSGGARPLGEVTSGAFLNMQRRSPNRSLHLDPLAELGSIKKRMGGR